jgi:hypothetical protein
VPLVHVLLRLICWLLLLGATRCNRGTTTARAARPFSLLASSTGRLRCVLRQHASLDAAANLLLLGTGRCDYFNAKFSLWNLDPSGKLRDRLSWKGYRSGHMMYLRQEDLRTANDDLRAFITTTTPAPDQPAEYTRSPPRYSSSSTAPKL